VGDLSDHFNRYEFKCHCGCGFDTVDAELIKVLEILRDVLLGPRIMIYSGCRCISHNYAIGGSRMSQHIVGKAADIIVEGTRPSIVADCLIRTFPNHYGIGRYKMFCHIDVRSKKARWDSKNT